MACNDRQLTDAQREAAFNQQRTGVVRAIRPFIGTPSIENLIDYLNRELIPALRASREKVNDVWKQVVDNAPSANPLAYYFSTTTTNADPTDGRIRLNQATQNTATVIRVSENNARLQTVQPWLDVMSGGPTTPLGTVTLVDAIDPGRFLRFDLNTMTDQGSYWDLGVTLIEASDTNPFVDGEAVTVGFIAGVSAAGSTVPVGSLSPIANDTFLGNVSGGAAAPAAVPFTSIDSTSITYDGTAHELRRAALTGFAEATANSNATTSAEPIVTYSASSNMSAERVTTSSTSVTVSTSVAGQIEFQRAALTSEVTASANSNATTVTRSTNFNSSPWTGPHNFEDQLLLGTEDNTAASGSVSLGGLGNVVRLRFTAASADIIVGTVSGCAEGRLLIVEFSGTGLHTVVHDASSADAFACPGDTNLILTGRGGFLAVGRLGTNNNWKILATTTDVLEGKANTFTATNTFSSTVAFGQKVTYTGIISPTALSADQNNYNPTGWSTANLVRLSTSDGTTRTLTGVSAGSSGELKWLVNLGPGFINISHEDASSTAANRFSCAHLSTFSLMDLGVIGIIYDATSSRWRPVKYSNA